MNKIYQFTIILVLICNVGIINAQQTSNHLTPVKGGFEVNDSQFEYHSRVRNVLFNGLTELPEVRFLVIPSFTPENVLIIDYDRNIDKYYLIYHICEQNIWYNPKWEEVKINKYRKEIDHKSVKLIKSLFDIATSQVKYADMNKIIYPDGSMKVVVGVDGTNYFFSVFLNELGMRSGAVWSPDKGSKMDKLVKIGESLVTLTKSEKERVSIDTELQKSIENLVNELK